MQGSVQIVEVRMAGSQFLTDGSAQTCKEGLSFPGRKAFDKSIRNDC